MNLYQWLKPKWKSLFTYTTKEYTGSEEFDDDKKFLGQQQFYGHDTQNNLFSVLSEIESQVEASVCHSIANETLVRIQTLQSRLHPTTPLPTTR